MSDPVLSSINDIEKQPKKMYSDECNTENKVLPLHQEDTIHITNSDLLFKPKPWYWYHYLLFIGFLISFISMWVVRDRVWYSWAGISTFACFCILLNS